MGIEFSKIPVSTLVGADSKTFRKIIQGGHVAPDKRVKYQLSRAICCLLSLFKPLQDYKYNKLLRDKPLDNDPIFILGHWRSGTTFVHNILAQDEHFGYTTTYQTVFPHLIMTMQWLIKPIMRWVMPSTRPTDKMELSPDQPQEEEFAMQNMSPYSYYNFWVFPDQMQDYCDRYLTMKKATEEEINDYKEQFLKLVKLSIWNSKRDVKDAQYLSKNPPHTGKVKTLVELFPNAKFIYLMRDPYTVFESSRSFITQTIAPIELSSIPLEQMEENILRNYAELYDAYQEQKKFIPKDNLFEIKFEDIEHDAMGVMERCYSQLQLPGWERARTQIQSFIDKKKGYKKNQYQYDQHTIDLVNKYCQRAINEWGYETK